MVFYKVINIEEFGDERGKLAVVENSKNIPFDIKRIFYVYGVTDGKSRGNHANINSKFFMICLNGSCKVKINNGSQEEMVVLDTPCKGVFINSGTWKEMFDFSRDSVLLVLSDSFYDKDEYINDYKEFKSYIRRIQNESSL